MSAGFRWTVSSQPRVLVLNRPMAFEPAPAHRKNRWAVDSLDYSAREVISIASGRMEVEATIKFEKNAQGLVDMLRDAADGNVVTYYPDLSNGTGYALWLVSESTELSPQAGNWSLGNYEVRTRWRDASASGTSIAPLFERLLFRLDAGHFPLGYSFTRSGSVGPYIDSDGVLKNAAANIARIEWVDLDGDGARETPGLLLELARTNDLLYSTDTEGASGWAGGTGWTKSSATSLFSGETARQYENDGTTSSNNRYQELSTLGSAAKVVSLIIENVDAGDTSVGIYDFTASNFVVRATYTWSTGAVAVASSAVGSSTGARAEILTENGPNGGRVVRIQAWGTPDNSGNTERVFVYPTGTSVNSNTAIVHHVQRELGTVASSPVITDGSAATRNADTFYAPFTAAPQEMTVYVKFVEMGTIDAGDSTRLWQIGAENPSTDARMGVIVSGGNYRMFYDDGVGLLNATLSAAPSVGDLVEIRAVLRSDGGITVGQSISEASETTATGGAVLGFDTAWADDRIYLNSGGTSLRGLADFLSVKVAPGTKTLAEMRAL